MAKLKGKAKAEFLARMREGRARAQRVAATQAASKGELRGRGDPMRTAVDFVTIRAGKQWHVIAAPKGLERTGDGWVIPKTSPALREFAEQLEGLDQSSAADLKRRLGKQVVASFKTKGSATKTARKVARSFKSYNRAAELAKMHDQAELARNPQLAILNPSSSNVVAAVKAARAYLGRFTDWRTRNATDDIVSEVAWSTHQAGARVKKPAAYGRRIAARARSKLFKTSDREPVQLSVMRERAGLKPGVEGSWLADQRDPGASAAREVATTELYRAMGKLRSKDRELLELYYLQGLPVAEVARRVGRPRDSVKVALNRIRNRLREFARNPFWRRKKRRKIPAEALEAYERFHGVAPKRWRRIGDGEEVLIALGELERVIYGPKRGDRAGVGYYHDFRPGATLAASVDGKRLFMLPSKRRPFRVKWDRGIVG